MVRLVNWILFFISVIGFVLGMFNEFLGKYEPIELVYLGSGEGVLDKNFMCGPENYTKQQYLFCDYGYGILDKETISRCNLHNLDFDLIIKKNKKYIYSYCVPLEKLEYCKNLLTVNQEYYNRATCVTDEYQDGIYYFYEIDDINIGTMWYEEPKSKNEIFFARLDLYWILLSLTGSLIFGYRIFKDYFCQTNINR